MSNRVRLDACAVDAALSCTSKVCLHFLYLLLYERLPVEFWLARDVPPEAARIREVV